jgi:hypothetical protein
VKAFAAMLLLSLSVFAFTIAQAAEIGTTRWKWDFDSDPQGQSPVGFSFARTGSGRIGQWVVKTEKDAPSGTNVLAQLDADSTSYRFPLAIPEKISVRDLRLAVRCKAISGKVDQACGLVFRYADENNYYVTRANALENNVRLYYVQNGKRHQLGDWSGSVTVGAWHELRVIAKGDQYEIYWNGKKVIAAPDRRFMGPGKVGLWTKADSITYFDDLNVESLNPR